MKLVFNIEMTVDVLLTEDARKETFEDLVTRQARSLYGVASVLTKKHPPKMRVTVVDNHGRSDIHIFPEDTGRSPDNSQK